MNALSDPLRYRLALHRAKGGYVATLVDLPGCAAHGATQVEAIESARDAIRAHLALTRSIEDPHALVLLEIAP